MGQFQQQGLQWRPIQHGELFRQWRTHLYLVWMLFISQQYSDDVFAPSPIVVGASTASIDYFFTFEQHLNSIRINLGAFNICFQFIAAPNQLAHCAISKVALAVLDRLVCRILA